MKKFAWATLLCFVFILLSGCVVPRPALKPPPPLKKEIRAPKPGPGHVWISGHWKWAGGKYVWIKGHWAKPPKGKVWVPGRWVKRGPKWVWVRGHWRKR